ncbi:MAG TPA: RecX family transcriptional regulator [Thermoanaerobaculia bacterium]|nr:RecX family transcriptional regulator [Thermoanaerobaculia bacterium]
MTCYESALRILSYRFNSVAELRTKLRAKRFEPAEIAETLARLTDEGWLDDARFAGAFVRTRQLKKIGPRRIERELQAAGVDRQTAQSALRENSDPDREREDLAAAVAKRRRMLVRRHGADYLETAEGRKKLTAFLLKQGYDAALIRSVVKETAELED